MIKRLGALMKVSFQYKQTIFMSIIFFILGVIFIIFDKADMQRYGYMYILLTPLFFAQMVNMAMASSMIKSSAYAYKIQTYVLVLLNYVLEIFGLALLLGITLIKVYVIDGGVNAENVLTVLASNLLLGACMGTGFQIYNTVAYKKFVLSIILLIAIYTPFIIESNRIIDFFAKRLSFGGMLAASFGILTIGCLISALFAYLLRRTPMDPWTYKRAIAAAK